MESRNEVNASPPVPRPSEPQGLSCGSDCAHCTLLLGQKAAGGSAETFRGGALAGASAGYFLVPALLGFGGALWGSGPAGQFVGASAGFAVGMAACVWVARRRHAAKEGAWGRQ